MNDANTNPGVAYERKDIRLGCLLAVMAVAVGVIAALEFGVWRYFHWEADMQQAQKRSPYSQTPPSEDRLPPEPRLEQLDRLAGAERSALDRQLADQQAALESYGSTADKGFVHIPIEQAIKALAGRLPVRKSAPAGATHDRGLIDAGEANSGRLFRKEER